MSQTKRIEKVYPQAVWRGKPTLMWTRKPTIWGTPSLDPNMKPSSYPAPTGSFRLRHAAWGRLSKGDNSRPWEDRVLMLVGWLVGSYLPQAMACWLGVYKNGGVQKRLLQHKGRNLFGAWMGLSDNAISKWSSLNKFVIAMSRNLPLNWAPTGSR